MNLREGENELGPGNSGNSIYSKYNTFTYLLEEFIMVTKLLEIFEDEILIDKIKRRLPYLFQIAELESSRAGKIGMEVGSLREKIIVALLIFKFGESNVETEIPITMPEVDVKVYNEPISIKTITGKYFGGVKIIWTVDAPKAKEFRETYYPQCDMLFIQIVWEGIGGLHYLPLEAQKDVFNQLGRENYIKLPKPGTNPRGVEITKDALTNIIQNELSKGIEISWEKKEIDFDPFKRWVDYWREN